MLKGVGVGLRARHYRTFLQDRPDVDWLEVHTENYLQPGGLDRKVLLTLREHYPFSFHGVGLGLGSARGFSERHLARVVALIQELEPALVSDHLCWGATVQRNLHDLLPVPLSPAMLSLFCERVDRLQLLLKRTILLENVSTYLRYSDDCMSEIAFLNALSKRTGCQILLDVNNLYVNQCNHGESAALAIETVAAARVGEIHLAGHLWSGDVVVDHHGDVVAEPVWALYQAALSRLGAVPTLIEWDTDVPELPVLLEQAALARALLEHAAPPTPAELPRAAAAASLELSSCAQRQADFCSSLLDYSTPDGLRAPEGTVEQRFSRYRGNQTVTWEKTLAAAYPVLQRLVGEECFSALAQAYGRTHPTSDPDLNHFGQHFAAFLAEFEPMKAWPYFPAMADLEWALHMAYYAADGAPVLSEHFLTLAPEALENLHFGLTPACRLLRADYAVGNLWLAHQMEGEVVLPALDEPAYTLIYRAGFVPRIQVLDASSFTFLQALALGLSFGVALDQALSSAEGTGRHFDLQALLALCLDYELLELREGAR